MRQRNGLAPRKFLADFSGLATFFNNWSSLIITIHTFPPFASNVWNVNEYIVWKNVEGKRLRDLCYSKIIGTVLLISRRDRGQALIWLKVFSLFKADGSDGTVSDLYVRDCSLINCSKLIEYTLWYTTYSEYYIDQCLTKINIVSGTINWKQNRIQFIMGKFNTMVEWKSVMYWLFVLTFI